MAREANFPKNVVWEINKGDFVRIRGLDSLGKVIGSYGIIVGHKRMHQQWKFPCIEVYNMDTNRIETQVADALEIISRAS